MTEDFDSSFWNIIYYFVTDVKLVIEGITSYELKRIIIWKKSDISEYTLNYMDSDSQSIASKNQYFEIFGLICSNEWYLFCFEGEMIARNWMRAKFS